MKSAQPLRAAPRGEARAALRTAERAIRAAAPVLLLAVVALLGACKSLAPTRVPASPGGVRFAAEAFPASADVDADSWMAAWPAWLASCDAWAAHPERMPAPAAAWRKVCEQARMHPVQSAEEAREFFAQTMDCYRVLGLERATEPGAPPQEVMLGRMTGYFEPVLDGSRVRSAVFGTPVYGPPAPLPSQTRAELAVSGRLQGYELAWLGDPLDAFFMEVQGSGRIHLADGTWLRLGYAGTNGQPYRSIGQVLVHWGELSADEVSLPAIRQWAQENPARLSELLSENPRVVFFRVTQDADPQAGPVGSLGVALRAGVSVAIDARYLPLGAPLLLTTRLPGQAQESTRIALAQDTGGAIHGPLRIDWFWGTGPQAGQLAGTHNASGSVRLLVPRGVVPQDRQ